MHKKGNSSQGRSRKNHNPWPFLLQSCPVPFSHEMNRFKNAASKTVVAKRLSNERPRNHASSLRVLPTYRAAGKIRKGETFHWKVRVERGRVDKWHHGRRGEIPYLLKRSHPFSLAGLLDVMDNGDGQVVPSGEMRDNRRWYIHTNSFSYPPPPRTL